MTHSTHIRDRWKCPAGWATIPLRVRLSKKVARRRARGISRPYSGEVSVKAKAKLLWLSRLAAGLWLAALPVFLIAFNGALAVNQPRLYYYGFDRFDIAENTGIKPEALRETAQALIQYFNSPEFYIQVSTEIAGEERTLFTDREMVHLKDVKDLVHKVYWAAGLSLAYLGGYAALRLGLRRRRSETQAILRLAQYGGLITLGLLLGLGLWALVGFGGLFYLFHIVSFSNPFWMLDPSQHYLIRLFPEGFFFQATLFIAAAVAVEALLVTALSRWALARKGRSP